MNQQSITFGVPDSLGHRAGIAGTWKSDNIIAVYASAHVRYNSKDAPSGYAPSTALIHHIRPEVIIFDTVLRQLVNEAIDVFLKVQLIDKTNENLPKNIWLKMSRRYRSIIRECLETLQDVGNKNESDTEKYSSYITIFYSIECVWHLCEILYLDQITGEAILNSLLEWIRFHFPEHERKAAKFLSSSLLSGAENDSNYWNTVTGVFLHGQIDVVRALLKLHTAWDTVPFQMVDNILRLMPLYKVQTGMSVSDFQQRWKHWQMDTRTKIASKAFRTQPKLEILMKLAVGDSEIWETEGIDQCDSWYEYLAARLLYTEPFLSRSHLGQMANKYHKLWPNTNRHIDQTMLAVMQQDLEQIIHEIGQMSENGWFAAHLTDLLYHSGQLKAIDTDNKNTSYLLRDSLLHDYGALLMGHHSLWQVGTHYLSHSGIIGLSHLALLLERIPLKTETRALKILQIAHKFEFESIAISVCRQRAVMSISRNRLGDALAWALKCRDTLMASQLADSLLHDYCSTGLLSVTDVLESLGSGMLVSDRLIFLGKYYEFQRMFNLHKYKEAASLLVALLSSKLTPKYFWSVLFNDAIALLECKEIVMSSTDTLELLHCVEQNSNQSDLSNKIANLRLAIARNIARALNHETQTT